MAGPGDCSLVPSRVAGTARHWGGRVGWHTQTFKWSWAGVGGTVHFEEEHQFPAVYENHINTTSSRNWTIRNWLRSERNSNLVDIFSRWISTWRMPLDYDLGGWFFFLIQIRETLPRSRSWNKRGWQMRRCLRRASNLYVRSFRMFFFRRGESLLPVWFLVDTGVSRWNFTNNVW